MKLSIVRILNLVKRQIRKSPSLGLRNMENRSYFLVNEHFSDDHNTVAGVSLYTRQFRHFRLFFRINLRYYAIYYLFISAGLILLIAGYSWLLILSQPHNFKIGMDNSFWMFINICGIILSTSAFFIYSKKNTAAGILTIPVSTLTRFITVFLYSIPLLFIISTCIYTIAANCTGWILTSMNYLNEYSFNPFRLDPTVSTTSFSDHFLTFLWVQSISLMAGSLFPKSGFIKSVCMCIITIVMYSIVNTIIMTNTFGNNFILNFINLIFTDDFNSHELLKQIPVISFIWKAVLIMVIPFCWLIS